MREFLKKIKAEGWVKRLNENSDWPFQPYVFKHTAELRVRAKVEKWPADVFRKSTRKEAERFFRAGARLAYEFGLDPVELLEVARKQIEKEIPGAKGRIAEAKAKELADHVVASEALKAQMLSFGKSEN